MTLSALLQPLEIGSLTLPNRMAMAPITVDFANPDETPSEQQIAYYAARAKGGAGLITLEVCTVDENHRYQAKSLGLWGDHLIEPHKKLVDAIHAHGAKVFPQLSHTGPESLAPFFKGMPSVGPSAIRTPTTQQLCRELAEDEIPALVALYGDAARRAQQAGYDGIELHAAHSYMLLGSFLSPLRNFRNDSYGGRKLETRMRLLLEVLADIRAKVGRDFPVVVRLSGFEREPGGRELNDTLRMAPALVAAGVDAFHISGGVSDNHISQIIPSSDYRQGYNLAFCRALKQVVDVPVIAVGRFVEPQHANEAIAVGDADAIMFGRALLADPELPNKVKANQLASVRPCTACQDCVDTILTGVGVRCAVNPQCAREQELSLPHTEQSKRLLVIGAGPAGMEAARLACEAGHQVTLCEASGELGGRLNAMRSIEREDRRLLDYLIAEVTRLPIAVQLNQRIELSQLDSNHYDAVIVATGAQLQLPPLPMADSEQVLAGHKLEQALKTGTLLERLPGQRVAVIGAGLIGLELGDALARGGKTAIVIGQESRVAAEVGKKRRGEECRRLDQLGASLVTDVQFEAIEARSVRYQIAGRTRELAVDHVLVAPLYEADQAQQQAAADCALPCFVIGDAQGFGLIKQALLGAHQVQQQLASL